MVLPFVLRFTLHSTRRFVGSASTEAPMSTPRPHEITELLHRWRSGDARASDALMPLIYDELRRLARGYMRGERHGHTLQTTALINEAYLRLAGQRRIDWRSRAQFFGIAAQLMRRVLVGPRSQQALREARRPRSRGRADRRRCPVRAGA
jgi:RNA polymerase sigma factor (TIGR02999 family)